jgi:hypothetical protein
MTDEIDKIQYANMKWHSFNIKLFMISFFNTESVTRNIKLSHIKQVLNDKPNKSKLFLKNRRMKYDYCQQKINKKMVMQETHSIKKPWNDITVYDFLCIYLSILQVHLYCHVLLNNSILSR